MERKVVPLLLASASILAAWILPKLLAACHLTVPWWFDAPSVMGFYGLFFAAFDRRLWRWRLWCTLGLTQVPDLEGRWTATITSSFDEHAVEHTARVRITQTWRSILIWLEADQSDSRSMIASLLVADPNEYVLNYEYTNTPRVTAKPTMHAHRGSAEVRFDRSGVAVGAGEYYSGRDRENRGTLRFVKDHTSGVTGRS